jgi:hypothetical protein
MTESIPAWAPLPPPHAGLIQWFLCDHYATGCTEGAANLMIWVRSSVAQRSYYMGVPSRARNGGIQAIPQVFRGPFGAVVTEIAPNGTGT